jgi:hypothetical protein
MCRCLAFNRASRSVGCPGDLLCPSIFTSTARGSSALASSGPSPAPRQQRVNEGIYAHANVDTQLSPPYCPKTGSGSTGTGSVDVEFRCWCATGKRASAPGL